MHPLIRRPATAAVAAVALAAILAGCSTAAATAPPSRTPAATYSPTANAPTVAPSGFASSTPHEEPAPAGDQTSLDPAADDSTWNVGDCIMEPEGAPGPRWWHKVPCGTEQGSPLMMWEIGYKFAPGSFPADDDAACDKIMAGKTPVWGTLDGIGGGNSGALRLHSFDGCVYKVHPRALIPKQAA